MSPEEQTPKPDTTQEPAPHKSLLGSKGLIIAAILVIIAIIIGASSLLGLGSTDQYQGYIFDLEQRIEDGQDAEMIIETVEIEKDISDEPLPIELEVKDVKVTR